jgi:hypothetical protein
MGCLERSEDSAEESRLNCPDEERMAISSIHVLVSVTSSNSTRGSMQEEICPPGKAPPVDVEAERMQ